MRASPVVDRMIVIKLIGGLGNQLFQYAAGRALAQHHGSPLGMDISWFEGAQRGEVFADHRRGFELDKFRIEGEIISKSSARRFSRAKFVCRALDRFSAGFLKPLLPGPVIYLERDSSYNPELANCPPSLYLDGYFQSWRYFERIEGQLRNELQLREAAVARRALLLTRASRGAGPLIGVHVRRGDFVHPAIQGAHLPPSKEYLTRAMASFGPSANFLIASDDAPWCRVTLGGPNVAIMDSGDMFLDLFAFGACDGYILSASSFSWWGAWLGDPGRNKRTVVPAHWRGGARGADHADDLLLKHWERL